jgi:SNF2 family DNA or RNA helicase
MLKPHFLRRLKEEVDKSIPPLSETVIEVGLTSL